jgi:hypothetical protein
MSNDGKRRWARTLRRLAIALASLFVILILGEIGLRVAGFEPDSGARLQRPWSVEDPELGWINRAGTHPSTEPGEVLMTFREDGRRAAGPLERLAGQVKQTVVVVGCSFTQGYGVRDDQTFAWLLDAAHPNVAFLNYGTGGYGTYQSMLAMVRAFEARETAPKAVVYGFVPFHASRNVQTVDYLMSLRSAGVTRRIAPHVRLEDGQLVPSAPGLMTKLPLARHSALVALIYRRYLQVTFGDRMAQAETATMALISRMRDLCDQNGSKLVVAILDDESGGVDYRDLFSRSRIDFVDCANPDWPSEALRVGGVGHPNEVLHAEWAERIGRHLKEALATR